MCPEDKFWSSHSHIAFEEFSIAVFRTRIPQQKEKRRRERGMRNVLKVESGTYVKSLGLGVRGEPSTIT